MSRSTEWESNNAARRSYPGVVRRTDQRVFLEARRQGVQRQGQRPDPRARLRGVPRRALAAAQAKEEAQAQAGASATRTRLVFRIASRRISMRDLLLNPVLLFPFVWSDARGPLLVVLTGIEAGPVLDFQIVVDESHHYVEIVLLVVHVLVEQIELRLAVGAQLVQ